MKKFIAHLSKVIFIALLFSFVSADSNSAGVKNTAFEQGEILVYRIHYGVFNAGDATLTIDDDLHTWNDKTCYRMNIYGKSTGAFKAVMKIKDTWRSYLDTTNLYPEKFYRNISENKYKLKEDVFYLKNQNKVKVKQDKKGKIKVKEFDVPENLHDIVSGYYYLRNLDYKNMKVDQKVSIKAFFEDKLYDFAIKYKGTKTIRTKFGKIKAYRIVPVMPDQELFDGEDSIEFFLSADENRVPLKVRAKMFLGAVELDIDKYSGLRYDLKKVK